MLRRWQLLGSAEFGRGPSAAVGIAGKGWQAQWILRSGDCWKGGAQELRAPSRKRFAAEENFFRPAKPSRATLVKQPWRASSRPWTRCFFSSTRAIANFAGLRFPVCSADFEDGELGWLCICSLGLFVGVQ